jgi:putative SOS response-associated peptidase YedK
MCNLYTNKKSAAEVADHFRTAPPLPFNSAEDVYPGYTGMVIRPEDSTRVLEAMTWGFPRHSLSKRTGLPLKPKPVNNARDDKLLSPRGMWRDSFLDRRCIIPLTAWSEPEGEPGRNTCTWYAPHDQELFAVAGIWRPTDEWGDAYSMVMVDGCEQMSDVHDRMPVILAPAHYDQWMLGDPGEAMELVRTCGDAMSVDRSSRPWGNARQVPPGDVLI